MSHPTRCRPRDHGLGLWPEMGYYFSCRREQPFPPEDANGARQSSPKNSFGLPPGSGKRRRKSNVPPHRDSPACFLAGVFAFRLAKIAAMPEPASHPNDPLHGITLETVLRAVVERHGWEEMAARIPIRCFMFDPTIRSSLTFLRKTPWARKRLEDWYVYDAVRDRSTT